MRSLKQWSNKTLQMEQWRGPDLLLRQNRQNQTLHDQTHERVAARPVQTLRPEWQRHGNPAVGVHHEDECGRAQWLPHQQPGSRGGSDPAAGRASVCHAVRQWNDRPGVPAARRPVPRPARGQSCAAARLPHWVPHGTDGDCRRNLLSECDRRDVFVGTRVVGGSKGMVVAIGKYLNGVNDETKF